MPKIDNLISEMLNDSYLLDRKKQASQARIYHQLMDSKPEHIYLYCHLLLWLGAKLVVLGSWLQQRFGKVEVVQDLEMLVAGENSGKRPQV